MNGGVTRRVVCAMVFAIGNSFERALILTKPNRWLRRHTISMSEYYPRKVDIWDLGPVSGALCFSRFIAMGVITILKQYHGLAVSATTSKLGN